MPHAEFLHGLFLTSAFALLGGGFVRSPKNPFLGFETSSDGTSAALSGEE